MFILHFLLEKFIKKITFIIDNSNNNKFSKSYNNNSLLFNNQIQKTGDANLVQKSNKTISTKNTTNINKTDYYGDKKSLLAINLAKNLIKNFEGLSLKSYKCPAGVWTIGYGNTSYLKKFKNPEKITITKNQACDLLSEDVEKYFKCVNQKLAEICNARQIAALTSFVFNVGQGAFTRSTLLKTIINEPSNGSKIKYQFARWNKIDGKVNAGLTKRRDLESKFYFGE
jgi:lysozyme